MSARGHIPRINEAIAAPEVFLVGVDGAALGVCPLADALAQARTGGWDLVEVQPDASPPACRLMEPGQAQRRIEARAEAQALAVDRTRALRFRPDMREADFRLKVRHGEWLLATGGALEIHVEIPPGGVRVAEAMLGRVLAALAGTGVPTERRRERDEFMALVRPRSERTDEQKKE